MQTILNVDPDVAGRGARTEALQRAGFDVREASGGFEALRLAPEIRPDLLALRFELPDIDAADVCQRLKQNPLTAGVVVLFMACRQPPPAEMARALDLGGSAFLQEPIDPVSLAATVRSLLRSRETEEALRRSNDELQQFAYMVSHELNEPLRMIASYSELLARKYRGKMDSEADEYIVHTVNASGRIQNFVQDLLSFSRATAPARRLMPVSGESILAEALYELQFLVAESGAVITHDPLPSVLGHEIRLARVFANLIGNSIKYRRENPPRIHISAHQQEDGFWRFEVRDNGAGIDPRYHDRIFQVFKRLHGKEISGSGIGLALCKRVVENHGGKIGVESTPGEGSTFYFTIPPVPENQGD